MMKRHQRYIPKLTNIAELKECFVDNMKWFISRTHIILQQTLIMCCCSWWTFWTLLIIEWAIGSWHSSLKPFSRRWKAVQSLTCCSWIFIMQLQIHLENLSLKFNLLYLLNHISCFNKFARYVVWILTSKCWKFCSNLCYLCWLMQMFFIGTLRTFVFQTCIL